MDMLRFRLSEELTSATILTFINHLKNSKAWTMNRSNVFPQPLFWTSLGGHAWTPGFCRRIACWWGLGLVISGYGLVSRLQSEEPYMRFLQRLRDEQHYDLAIVYLDQLDGSNLVGPEFAVDAAIERGLLLYQTAASMPESNPVRESKLSEAESVLRGFLTKYPKHPQQGAIRLKLGELLLSRAEQAKAKFTGQDIEIPGAIKYFDEAHHLYEETIQKLAAELETMRGARIDPTDTAAVAHRERLQLEIRQAQLLSAKAVEDRGRARGSSHSTYKTDLQNARAMFADLYAKEQSLVVIRNYALYYRSKIDQSLNKLDDALDGFQRVIDLQGVAVLRALQNDALTAMIEVLMAQKKFQVAVDRADRWVRELKGPERETLEAINLQIKLAEAKLAWSKNLKEKDANDRVAGRLVRDVASDLQQLRRYDSAPQEKINELLIEAGGESQSTSEEPVSIKDITSFAEAQGEGERLLLDYETGRLRDDADVPEQQAVLSQQRDTAISYFKAALRLFGQHEEDGRAALDNVRIKLSYLLLQQQQPWEALAISEFVALQSQGGSEGLQAANVALGAYGDLLKLADPKAEESLKSRLEPFAQHLVTTWPESNEASAAMAVLVQIAMTNGLWEKAEEYIQLLPVGSGLASRLRRDAGITTYLKYIEAKRKDSVSDEELSDLRGRAIELLAAGVADESISSLDESGIQAVNILARLYLATNELSNAGKLLSQELVDRAAAANSTLSPRVKLDVYLTILQVKIRQMVSEQSIPAQAVTEIKDLVAHLQPLSTGVPDGTQLIAATFVQIAADLKAQIETAGDIQLRRQLAEGLQIVVAQIGQSGDAQTRVWATEMMLVVADELAQQRTTVQQAHDAYRQASNMIEGVLAEQATAQNRKLAAHAARGQGDFTNAIEQLAQILIENPNLLDIQMEAARTYDAWGAARNNPKGYELAMLGNRPDPKTRENLIWGWLKLSNLLAGRKGYETQFFECRFELAQSRYLSALLLTSADEREKAINQAEKAITSVAALYPQMGGPTSKKRFDTLLRKIQTASGKPVNGLN